MLCVCCTNRVQTSADWERQCQLPLQGEGLSLYTQIGCHQEFHRLTLAAVDIDSWHCRSPLLSPSHRCSPSLATIKTCACAFRSAPCRDSPPMLSWSSSPHCLPPHACLIRFPGIPLPSATIKPLSNMRYTPFRVCLVVFLPSLPPFLPSCSRLRP